MLEQEDGETKNIIYPTAFLATSGEGNKLLYFQPRQLTDTRTSEG